MFKFNGEYKDVKQIEEFYPQFCKVDNKFQKEGKYAYNSMFKGQIKGIEGEDEDTVIYLLQHLKTQKSREEKIKKLLEDGFTEVKMGEGIRKFEKVVMVGTGYSEDSTKEFEGAKILFEKGYANFIIPKRFTKRGIMLYGDRQVFAK